jgi:hypothetical protein
MTGKQEWKPYTLCLVPGCQESTIYLRGLCRPCYVYASSLIFHRIASWEQLEASGVVGPVGNQIQSPRRPERTAWFAKGCGLSPESLAEELKRRNRDYEQELHPSRRRRK